MQQHHRAGVGPRQQLGEGLLPGGLGIVVPVHVGKAPENRPVAQSLRHAQVFLTVYPLRRAVVFGHVLTGGVLVQRLQVLQFLCECRLFGNFAHVVVVHGVVAHDMPFLRHSAHQIGVFLDVVAHEKKGRLDVVLLQRVQYFLRAAVFVASVKGQVQHLFRRAADVRGVVPLQLVDPGVADGRRTLLPEAQPPRPRGQRAARKNPHCRHRRRGQRRQQYQ